MEKKKSSCPYRGFNADSSAVQRVTSRYTDRGVMQHHNTYGHMFPPEMELLVFTISLKNINIFNN
jgi:hypothetical protein